MKDSKKSVFFIADVKNWAFDNIAQYLKPVLETQYNVTILYTSDFENPGKLIDELNKFDNVDYIHFFYRGYLKHLLEYISSSNINENKLQKFLSAGVTTSIPDHLFIQNTSDILNYQQTLSFVDYYYTISKKLHDIYSKISFYPKPWEKVIFDNVFIEKQNPDFNDNKKLVVTWIGNSAWGECYFEKGYDAKGYHSVIVPTFAALDEQKIDVEQCIADGAQKKRTKAEIFEILKNTDILLISANTDGTPLPLIEAMASGCAIITTHNGIAPEVLPQEQQQFILNKKPEEFVDAIKILNSDRKLLKRLKEQNFDAYEKIFCNENNFKELWFSLIEDTISKSKMSSRIEEKKNILEKLNNNYKKDSRSMIKKILLNNKVKRVLKYLLKHTVFKKLAISLYSIIKSNDIRTNLYNFKGSLINNVVSTNSKEDVYALCPDLFPGVLNSTLTLFDKTTSIPSSKIIEFLGMNKVIVDRMALDILNLPIRNLVISGGNTVLFELIKKLHELKGKKTLNIYFLWHGSVAQWLSNDPHHLEHFDNVHKLYSENKIKGLITLKKDFEIVLQSYGIKTYLLQNFIRNQYNDIIKHHKTDKIRVGIWSASAVWVKNLYPQIVAASLLKDKINLHTNFKFSEYDSWIKNNLTVKSLNNKLPHDELMREIAGTDITLYVTNTECSPMIALESLSLGIPCLVGPTSALYDNDEFLKEMLTVNRVDCPVAISEALNQVIENYETIKSKLPIFIDSYNNNANLLKQKFLKDIEIAEEDIFTEIYATNFWTNGSGPGSAKNNTIEYRSLLQEYFKDPKFKTYADLGCGDWQIMELIDIPDDKIYKGYDIAKTVIDSNKKKHEKENVKFNHITDINKIEPADLLIVKDVMIHWTNERVTDFLTNILPKFKYALLTEGHCLDDNHLNTEINFGQFRYIDISKPPFNCKNIETILKYKTNSSDKIVYLYTNPKN